MLIVHGDESNGRTDPMDIDGRKDLNITGNKQKNNKHPSLLNLQTSYQLSPLPKTAFGAENGIPLHCPFSNNTSRAGPRNAKSRVAPMDNEPMIGSGPKPSLPSVCQ